MYVEVTLVRVGEEVKKHMSIRTQNLTGESYCHLHLDSGLLSVSTRWSLPV